MKVVITTHFSWMQQIDEYSALLNVCEDNGYSLGSQTDHDLSYFPLNWKRETETSVIKYRAEWTQSCNPEYIIELTKK